ncbi:MAG: hypothetical protein LQ351_000712 [Letrouitia transgressa]|nr:MAG: hypothetical protein LQ351_000712 [Letrouitia transgressa]
MRSSQTTTASLHSLIPPRISRPSLVRQFSSLHPLSRPPPSPSKPKTPATSPEALASLIKAFRDDRKTTTKPKTAIPTASNTTASNTTASDTTASDTTAALRAQRHSLQRAVDDSEKINRANNMERQMYSRRWQAGDVYAPHDLSEVETLKWRAAQYGGPGTAKWKMRRGRRQWGDAFDILALNPISEYKAQNFSMITEHVSSTGRIKHARETGLRPVNQRRLAKAVRRAVGMGLMPSVHKHPEMLEEEAARMMKRRMGVGRFGL